MSSPAPAGASSAPPSGAHTGAGPGMGTKTVHLGHGAEPLTGAIMPPISLSTTFEQRAPGVPISVRSVRAHADEPPLTLTTFQ